MEKTVFIEEIKVAGGEYHNLEGHAIRMDHTIRHFFHKPFIQSTLPKLLPEPPADGRQKCVVTYADAVIDIQFEPFTPPTINSLTMVEVKKIDFNFKTKDRGILPRVRERGGSDEAIIVHNSFFTNATTGNLVFQDEAGNLITPLHYIHSGTKREYYLKKKRITTHPIKAERLEYFVKVFLINALIDLEDDVSVPVKNIKPIVRFTDAPDEA
ncbi:MAG: hypothetical protein LBO66_15200 [Deltaproteobacteria bacterium]|jgi:4-amino-4-deoxychorismate lyase|nr:hypothetical protein [Deltaproteobacteria bacterium]